MTPAELLDAVWDAGARLVAEPGDRLRVVALRPLPADLVVAVRVQRDALRVLVASRKRTWRCPVDLGTGHIAAHRSDGSLACGTCHPLAVATNAMGTGLAHVKPPDPGQETRQRLSAGNAR